MAKAQTAEKARREEHGDRPLIDSQSETSLKKLISNGKERGYITYEELNDALPEEQASSEEIENFRTLLSEMGVNLIEGEDVDEQTEKPELASVESESAVSRNSEGTELAETKGTEVVVSSGKTAEVLERTDDPVRMYLREMGSVELLSREGEIAIAKRIEAGREAMIAGICESPLTIRAVIEWHDMLMAGSVLLRDIIDLDATYGAGPDGKKNQGMANHDSNSDDGVSRLSTDVALNGGNGAAAANDDNIDEEGSEAEKNDDEDEEETTL